MKPGGVEQSENDLAHSGTFIQPALCQHIVGDIGVAPENAAPPLASFPGPDRP
jgi:hypothetical protein